MLQEFEELYYFLIIRLCSPDFSLSGFCSSEKWQGYLRSTPCSSNYIIVKSKVLPTCSFPGNCLPPPHSTACIVPIPLLPSHPSHLLPILPHSSPSSPSLSPHPPKESVKGVLYTLMGENTSSTNLIIRTQRMKLLF